MSFFVPRLIDEPVNKEEEELNERSVQLRSQALLNTMTKQFQLVYFGKFSYSELDELSVSEFETVYNLLIQQKDEEKKAQDEALRKAKEKSKSRR